MYKSEAAFSKELCSEMRKLGWFIQLIEVGAINSGVPDVYMVKKGVTFWVELKNNKFADFAKHWHIDFRKGQQAWLLLNYKHGGHSVVIEAGSSQMAIHFFHTIIKENILFEGYTLVNGFERLDYLLLGGK